MQYQELAILLPCHSLEDFPVHHDGEKAHSLLANWTALWHPQLIDSAKSMPTWSRVDNPPADCTDRLLLVPTVSDGELPTGFDQRAANANACLIRNETSREAILNQALAHIQADPSAVDSELAFDFLALGYCFLQIQLLTRQMHYSSNLDEIHFNSQVVIAAETAVNGTREAAIEKLTACFDVLMEERDHYYPLDAYIVDLTLVADSTIADLGPQLDSETAVNFLIRPETLARISETFPDVREKITTRIEDGSLDLVSGDQFERRLPLMSQESIVHELRRGYDQYSKIIGRPPTAYGRYSFGLCAALPQLLCQFDYRLALHSTFDGGQFPEASQFRARWSIADSSDIAVLARPPKNGAEHSVYLNYGVKMGESMDMDHCSVIFLAHWPGNVCDWYSDLKRISKYSSVLGKFVTIQEFFELTDDPGHTEHFPADAYQSPFLANEVAQGNADPISRVIDYWKHYHTLESAKSLTMLATAITGDPDDTDWDADLERIDAALDGPKDASLGDQLEERATNAMSQFAAALPRAKQPATPGYLVANPNSYVRRISMKADLLPAPPPLKRPVYASEATAAEKFVVADIPPMGFAWISGENADQKKGRGSRKPGPLLADENFLRNDFFEAGIDARSGGLRSIHPYNLRGNRLSQQLALRYRDPTVGPATWSYSKMVARSIKTVASTSTYGEIVAEGDLLNEDKVPVAGFVQTYRVWMGSRILNIDIELTPNVELGDDPWNSYFAARFAWKDETAELFGALNQIRQPLGRKKIESPYFIDLETEKERTSILTGGIPWHRRRGSRELDSILMVKGETRQIFSMGIGIDLTHPVQSAVSMLTPPRSLFQTSPPPAPVETSWLFQIDTRNVVATAWSPLIEGGKVVGFRVGLLETMGRRSHLHLSTFRELISAKRIDGNGKQLDEIDIEDGKLAMDFVENQFAIVEGRW